MGSPAYATVEQVSASLDFKASAFETGRLSRLVSSASRRIDRRLHRHFYPLTETRTWVSPRAERPPNTQNSGFWLGLDLRSLTTVTVDTVSKTVADLEVYPTHHGPPFSWLGVTGVDIAVVAVWGYTADTTPAGVLAEALDDSETGVNVGDSSLIGIGDLILVDTEQMIVTAKTQLDTAQNLGTTVTADKAITTIDVSDGTGYAAGEVILIESEDMLIVSISSNALTVKRAWDGSVLAAHSSGKDIFAPRTLTVERGAVGTTAATHNDTTAITRNVAPGPIIDLTIAEAITTYQQETSGYGRTIGSGDNTREARGVGLENARL